ncbi:unnamed protein product [Fraxinus pennsylvanica]|uniref:NADPH-dependent 1-acyldihydroxyacetone phosphate reductase n=1 Tax=Fraxinus pennsylvanica TaxID=56036 RepID=A0AAD1ZDH6_9LAMI|nr:unnamed protein product [Fraxinus pennsylvanica]
MSDQKVVLVTGCAKGGIGYEYCKAFAEKNCHVFASDIPQRMQDLEDLHSEKIETLELDVSSDESATSAINSVMSRRGRIDILINNAGIGGTGPLAELPLDVIRRTYEINTLGQLRMIQQVVPHMVAQRSGSIVNIGSVVGRVPTPWTGAYCTSKAAVHAISDTLRVELRPFEIDVILVLPGAIKSNLGRNNLEKLKNYDWKVYKDFNESIIERARASQVGKSTDAALFARHVASKVLSPKPPKQIVFGHMTGLFTFLSWSPLWGQNQAQIQGAEVDAPWPLILIHVGSSSFKSGAEVMTPDAPRPLILIHAGSSSFKSGAEVMTPQPPGYWSVLHPGRPAFFN